MTHKNYYSFKADSYFALGLQLGETFKKEAKMSIDNEMGSMFEQRKKIAKNMLQLTKIKYPQYIAEIQGYAIGAGVNLLDLWTLTIEDDTNFEESNKAKCTSIITNDGKLLAHSEDQFDAGMENTVCLVKKTINELTLFEIYYYNTLGGVSVGVNSNGYAVSTNSLLNGVTQTGIPKCIPGRILLETSNPELDFHNIKNTKLADGYNHSIINSKGKIVNIELSSRDAVLSFPDSPFAHSNHCLKLQNRTMLNDKYGTISRLQTAQHETKPKMTTDEIKIVLEKDNLGPNKSIYNERTVGRMIINLENYTSYVWLLREEKLGWVEYKLDFIKSN